MTTAHIPTPATHPFLVSTVITVTLRNQAGIEEKKTEEAVFPLDQKGASMPAYVLRNFLVPSYLRKKIGPEGTAWLRIYEIKILKVVNRQNPDEIDGIPLRVMTFPQLTQYVRKWELPIHPEEFHSVDYARQMIALYETDPKGFETQRNEYLAGKGRQYPELDEVRAGAESASDVAVTANLAQEMAMLGAGSGKQLPQTNPVPEASPRKSTRKKAKTASTPKASTPAPAVEAVSPPDADDPFNAV
jgi:hypothetical protein